MSTRPECLAGFPVVSTLPLQWGDQDPFGHVNNTIYMRWSETARIEYMIRVGMWPEFPPVALGPILANIKCDFKLPMTYPDNVWVGTKVVRIGNTSLRMDHRIVSEKAGVVAAELESTLVILDYSQYKPVRVPDAMRQAIAELEATV